MRTGKPRLRFFGRVWSCVSLTVDGRLHIKAGYGYTPEEAFKDWEQQ